MASKHTALIILKRLGELGMRRWAWRSKFEPILHRLATEIEQPVGNQTHAVTDHLSPNQVKLHIFQQSKINEVRNSVQPTLPRFAEMLNLTSGERLSWDTVDFSLKFQSKAEESNDPLANLIWNIDLVAVAMTSDLLCVYSSKTYTSLDKVTYTVYNTMSLNI